MSKKIIFLTLAFFFSLIKVQAVVVGSNTTVSAPANVVFPRLNTDNEMRGFAAFSNGFTLEGATTTCTFNSLFPISGTVNLNGGKLYLTRDLYFGNGTTLNTLGSFFGNSKNIFFPSNLSGLNSGTNLQISAFTQVAAITLSGSVNSVSWDSTNSYIAAGKNTSAQLEILSFNGGTYDIASVASANLSGNANSVRFNPLNNYIAIADAVSPAIRSYLFDSSNQTLSLISSAAPTVPWVACAWRPQGGHLAAGGNSNNVAVYPVTNGVLGTVINANLNPTGAIQFSNSISWDPTGTYLAVGAAASAGTELLVYYFNGTTLTLTVSAELGLNVQSVSWNPLGSYIAIGLSGATQTIRVYEHRVSQGTLLERTTARINETVAINTVNWANDGSYLAYCRASAITPNIYVYTFNSSAVTLSQTYSAGTGFTPIDVEVSPDNKFIAVGGTSNQVRIYSITNAANQLINSTIFDSSYLVLNNDLQVNVTTTLQTTCTIDGQGHTLTIGGSGKLVSQGNLTLRNITINGVTGNNLQCISDTSNIIFEDASIQLSGNYTLTQGSFLFQNNVIVNGPYAFIYSSNQTSTIDSKANLIFDTNTTFSYYPPTTSQILLNFADNTSRLRFTNSTLCVTPTGLKLTKGILEIDKKVIFKSYGTVPTTGIIFGDGTSSGNDLTVNVLSESQIELQSGYIMNNNIL